MYKCFFNFTGTRTSVSRNKARLITARLLVGELVPSLGWRWWPDAVFPWADQGSFSMFGRGDQGDIRLLLLLLLLCAYNKWRAHLPQRLVRLHQHKGEGGDVRGSDLGGGKG